jgi:hypothetical protein
MLRAQQRAADAYLPLSGALKARNTRDVLEPTAVQLITPNLPEEAEYETEGERGRDSKTIFTAKLIGRSHFGATLAPEGYSILFDDGHQPGRPHQRIQMAGCEPASDRQPGKRRLGFIAGLNRPVGNAAGVEKID